MNEMNEGGKPQEPTTNLYGQAGTGRDWIFFGLSGTFLMQIESPAGSLKGPSMGSQR